VGYSGTMPNVYLPLVERWRGGKWSLQHAPAPAGAQTSELSDVSCPNENSCTAVGWYSTEADREIPLVEAWNGRIWVIQLAPSPAGSTDSELVGVSCLSARACMAVGDSSLDVYPYGLTLAETWNGSTRSIEPPATLGPTAYSSELHFLSCASANDCTAVGSYGSGFMEASPLAERWNGASWRVEPTPDPDPVSQPFLMSVSCPSAKVCVADGIYFDKSDDGYQPIVMRWNGIRWVLESTPDPKGRNSVWLGGVSCSSAKACMIVGSFAKAPTTATTALSEHYAP